MPTIVSACTYGTEWVKWWTATQPQERETKQWPFPRDSISDVGWSKFPANGKDGIFLAIMGLSWWPPAIKSLSEVAFFEEAVTEIHWVIQELIQIRTRQASYPPPPPSQDESNPHQHNLIPCPPASCTRSRTSSSRPHTSSSRPRTSSSHPRTSSSRPHTSSSRPPVSTFGTQTYSRGEGKRSVKLTWKALAGG